MINIRESWESLLVIMESIALGDRTLGVNS